MVYASYHVTFWITGLLLLLTFSTVSTGPANKIHKQQKLDEREKGSREEHEHNRNMQQVESMKAIINAAESSMENEDNDINITEAAAPPKYTSEVSVFPFQTCLMCCVRKEGKSSRKTGVGMYHDCHRKCLANPHMCSDDNDVHESEDIDHQSQEDMDSGGSSAVIDQIIG